MGIVKTKKKPQKVLKLQKSRKDRVVLKNEEEPPKKVDVKVMALKMETSDIKGNVELGGEFVDWVDHRFIGMWFPEKR